MSLNFVSANKILIPENAPATQERAVFFNSYTDVGGARNAWQTKDLSSVVPADCVAIHVSGVLIITHGSNAETADLQLYFRKNNTISENYNHQVIETQTGGGQRCTMACWIPLDDNKSFQWKWNTSVYNGSWPSWSAFGANLQIDAVAVNEQ